MKYYITILFAWFILISNANAQQFSVSYSPAVFSSPFTGHVILYLSKTEKEPKNELYEPCYARIVKAIRPGEAVLFDNRAIAHPAPLSKLERGAYYVQAVWDRDLGGRNIGTSPGNLYSKAVQVAFTSDTAQVTTLVCDQLVPQPIFVNSTYIKELKAPSGLLSKFSRKPMTVDAAVILPAQYFSETKRKFPVVFNIGGYGADYHHYSKENGDTASSIAIDTTACIKVYLDGNCSLGHCVYANSENTGPWGDALTKDFIPLLKKTYRCNGAFLAKGHSSGGWAALWLQIHYPQLFAGCNASSPDPVDFRSFVKENMYELKPLKNYKYDYEEVIYRGEQNRSFDAVYGPRGKRGEVRRLYDYTTGKLNPDVLEHWKQYDISLYLRKNWPKLKGDLRDKIRISVGNEDTYSLNLPVHLMEEEMKKINATITFAYYPGDHGSVRTPAYLYDQDKWLEDKYQEWLKPHEK
ncbi:MAG TPA: alpha/beta hydrolase-fold protein [Mucilaginibacter sp.]|jgi:pimeloyl-ACP methyl ester carboxylesterase